MRNREQIYGQEAAGLLRNITVYHCMRRDQLLRLYPGKEGVIENLLRYLVKQQRIFYNTDRDCYPPAWFLLQSSCFLPCCYSPLRNNLGWGMRLVTKAPRGTGTSPVPLGDIW